MIDELEAGIFGEDLAGAGFALQLGGGAHDAMQHQDAALAVELLGDRFHGDPAGFEIIGADVAVADGLRRLVDEHERDAGLLDVIHGRGAGFQFAGVQDDRVDLLGDEVLDLAELLLDVGLGVDHHDLHAGFRLRVGHDGLGKLGGIFGGKITG